MSAIQLQVPPDLATLIEKRIASGAYSSPEDVVRQALELQDAEEEESLTEEQRQALAAQIEQGYLQAFDGELIESEEARAHIGAMKMQWRLARR